MVKASKKAARLKPEAPAELIEAKLKFKRLRRNCTRCITSGNIMKANYWARQASEFEVIIKRYESLDSFTDSEQAAIVFTRRIDEATRVLQQLKDSIAQATALEDYEEANRLKRTLVEVNQFLEYRKKNISDFYVAIGLPLPEAFI